MAEENNPYNQMSSNNRLETKVDSVIEIVSQVRVDVATLHAQGLPDVKRDVDDLKRSNTQIKTLLKVWGAGLATVASVVGFVLSTLWYDFIGGGGHG